jgi:hypothetical protein
MSNEHEQKPDNRSSALSPEALGAVNMATAAAVKEAVAGVFAALGPMLKEISAANAMSPEKLGAVLREAGKDPKKEARDAAAIEREIREMLIWKEDEEQNRKLIQDRQDNCPHIDENGHSSVQLVHNFPDQHPRGICAHCQCLIHPKEWRIGAPTKEFPRGKPCLVNPHKNYMTVMQLQHRS